MVVLEEDMALDLIAKTGNVLELALGHSDFEGLAAARVFQDFGAVEPVLDVVALDDDA